MIRTASKSMIFHLVFYLSLLSLSNFAAAQGHAEEVDYFPIIGALEMRGIGPAIMGGRTGYRRPALVAPGGGTLPGQLSRRWGSVIRDQGPPTRTQTDRFDDIKKRVEPLFTRAPLIQATDIPELNRMLIPLNFPIIK